MNVRRALLAILLLTAGLPARAVSPAEAMAESNEALFRQLKQVHGLSESQLAAVRAIFARSGYIGQGNPAITRHPATPDECRARLASAGIDYENKRFDEICGARYMAPLYDPATEKPEDARTCIDRFEFPNIPCAYPVVWVRAGEAAEICAALGKRICDAHEWEGACAGSLQPPDYRFDLAAGQPADQALRRMRAAHNQANSATKTWSYGPAHRTGVCACASTKTAGCTGGSWTGCGSNTYPAGFFPDCRSPLEVFDLNGNAAEHMNLPLDESQMASRGSIELGLTEMKGSWFIFDAYQAHEDWCRWRAPYWHGSRVMDPDSHRNYHLGFRCCKTIKTAGEEGRGGRDGRAAAAEPG